MLASTCHARAARSTNGITMHAETVFLDPHAQHCSAVHNLNEEGLARRRTTLLQAS